VAYVLLGTVLYKKILPSTWLNSLAWGKPRFFPINSPAKRYFDLILGCVGAARLHFDPRGEAVLRKIAVRDDILAKAIYHRNYQKAGYGEDGWEETWTKITSTKYLSTTLGEAIVSGRWGVFALRVPVVTRLVSPFVVPFFGVTTWLLAEVASGHNILRLVQVTLILGFIIAAILFVNFTLSLRAIRISTGTPFEGDPFFPNPILDDEVQTEVTREVQDRAPTLEEEIKELEGTIFYPTLEIDDNYVDLIRKLFTRLFFVASCSSALVIIILLLVQWPLSIALSDLVCI
jgi:hypothetical protein